MKVGIKKAFNKKRIIAVAALFLLVLVIILSNPDALEFFSSADALKLSVSTGVEYDISACGDEMLIANNEGVFAIDRSGNDAWNVIAATATPELVIKDRYFMLADINGRTVRTYKKEKLVAQIDTQNEILSAKMNKNGSVALATDELGFKGMVTIYNANGREEFKWHSGEGYIGDIDISDSGRLAVAQLSTDKDKVYSKIIIIKPNSKSDSSCIAEIEGVVMKLLYRDNDTLLAVSDKGVYAYGRSGKQKFVIDFKGRKPIECNIENENNLLLAFDSGLNSTVLESYSSRGKLRGSYDAGSNVLALDVKGECIVAATREGIVRINPKGSVKGRIKASKDVKDIRLFSGRTKLICLGEESAEIMKIR